MMLLHSQMWPVPRLGLELADAGIKGRGVGSPEWLTWHGKGAHYNLFI